MQQSFEVGRNVFSVRTTSAAFGAWLRDTFAEYETSDELGARYSIVVADGGDRSVGKQFHVLYKSGSPVIRTMDLAELARVLRTEFDSFLYADWDEAIFADMTVVSRDGTAALLPNADLYYLTRISRKVQQAGVSVPSGGRVAIDPDTGRLLPVPARHAVTDEALAELARYFSDGALGLTEPPAEAPAPAAVDAVCMYETVGEDELLRPATRIAAVKRLTQSVVNLNALGARALEGLAKLTEQTPCFELGWDDPAGMLDALVAALEPAKTAEVAAS